MKIIQKHLPFCNRTILFMLIFVMPAFMAASAEGAETPSATPAHYYTATYFHGSFRCGTCQRIETLSEKAITNHFAQELKSGALVWRAVNVDEPENQHYVKDYSLFTKSLIISEVKDGKEIRWKNLEKVWNFVRNEDKFDEYVLSEVKAWMGQ
ncbi:MAG: nitrophenyl compound nitroreductase subunit ArsF family protein [Desulfobacterales bacterium]|jgi:hypothetical protein|nr:nitrophenyl compound nitroreductase subunit ArsF family protein [Desulfobacterales bacterium]